MPTEEENRIIRHEFRHRNRRGVVQLLTDIRERLRRPTGWAPPIQHIVARANRLGIAVKWSL